MTSTCDAEVLRLIHDIHNILSVIGFHVELLLEHDGNPDTHAEDITEAIRRATTRIAQFKAIARERGPRVLLVDDEPSLRLMLGEALRRDGIDVMLAESGEAALEACTRDADIDLLIADVSLPGLTGSEVAQRLRETRPQLPVVLMSGRSDIPEADGRDRFVAKPFSLSVFRQAVRDALADQKADQRTLSSCIH